MSRLSFCFYLWIFLLIIFTPSLAAAADGIEILDEQVNYSFAEELTFKVLLNTADVSRVDIIIQTPGTPSLVGAMTTLEVGEWFFRYDLAARPLPAFAPVAYTFRIVNNDGDEFVTEKKTFTYIDDRFNWQQLKEEPFQIFWYDGEITFAQQVLDTAQKGREQILALLQQPATKQPINIFIYRSEEDLQQTLQSTNQIWVGGHASPEFGAVVASLPPGVDQALEIQRQIPHEISHILLYRYMGAEYQYLPIWVSEGIASQMEFYSQPEYALILEKAAGDRQLIPLNQLCNVFPADPELIILAYAESNSVIDYVQQEYGITGIQALISAYDQGVSCERGVEIALGKRLSQLEREWKQAVIYRSRNLWIIGSLGLVLILLLAALGAVLIKKSNNPQPFQGGMENV